jgi:hypothetical protein
MLMKIDFSKYENGNHAPDSQQERIHFLITKLREYKSLPVKEMYSLMPVLWEVEKKCKIYDAENDIPGVNYIIEILKELEAEHFQPEKRNNFIPVNKIDNKDYDELSFYV